MAKYPHSQITLDNGLRLLYVPSMDAESVVVSSMGKVGRRTELDSEVGSAHFLEHLFFDGTKSLPNETELKKFLENHGGNFNGSTGTEDVEYWAKMTTEKAEVAFQFLSDIFFNSLLEDSSIEKEKMVIAQEASGKRDTPGDLMGRIKWSGLYPDQAFGRTIFDEEANLPNMNAGMLRGYMERNYVKENFVLAVSGNISEAKAIQLGNKYFGPFASGRETIFEPARFVNSGYVKILNKDFNQSCLAVSFRGLPTFDERYRQIDFLSVILGDSSSSRLEQKLRHEQHLVYSVWSSLDGGVDTGCLSISTRIKEENLQRALDLIFVELKRLTEEDITDEELTRARNIALSGYLFYVEKVHSRATAMAEELLLNKKIKSIEEDVAAIKAVTKSDIREMARYVFFDQPKINIITKNPIEVKVIL